MAVPYGERKELPLPPGTRSSTIASEKMSKIEIDMYGSPGKVFCTWLADSEYNAYQYDGLFRIHGKERFWLQMAEAYFLTYMIELDGGRLNPVSGRGRQASNDLFWDVYNELFHR
ncbi:Oidioi.mRNA.OKI2018_I69.chr2.g8269.t1.cds [Oikopleura dioica]|uniref:Oidioi.mRNA.OKI2018_I69.chr2.g8269.t1.cds n=1 Tax=Oikopleura dioica TaxID=34765 RepID=A0ABN7TDC8_OIKDI|nr:Oidioi.mRNA.OKI2018_I69.chr2.g8269.t1.cds [Oikopleura dioica]